MLSGRKPDRAFLSGGSLWCETRVLSLPRKMRLYSACPRRGRRRKRIVLLLVCDCFESWKVSQSVYYLMEGPRLSHWSCLECEVGVLERRLETLRALSEDRSSGPCVYSRQLINVYNFYLKGFNSHFWPPWAHTYTCIQTLTHTLSLSLKTKTPKLKNWNNWSTPRVSENFSLLRHLSSPK